MFGQMVNRKAKNRTVVESGKSPDEICDAYAKKKVRLELRVLGDDESDPNQLILIQGSRTALEMLSELIASVARDESSKISSFSLSPRGAGSTHFKKSSQFGIYINRV
jgi:hypothetical protein